MWSVQIWHKQCNSDQIELLKCAAGQSDKIKDTLKDKFWPTLLAGYAVWPLAHVINFRFIPNSQRVLYINAVNVRPLLLSMYMPCNTPIC